MANAKRASMREGPLAALFRKTEEGEDAAQAAGGAAPRAQQPPRARAARPPPRTRARAACRTRRSARRAAGAAEPEAHVPIAAGAPAPRLLLGDPRERDGAPGAGDAAPRRLRARRAGAERRRRDAPARASR